MSNWLVQSSDILFFFIPLELELKKNLQSLYQILNSLMGIFHCLSIVFFLIYLVTQECSGYLWLPLCDSK